MRSEPGSKLFAKNKEAEELYKECIKLRDRNSRLREENRELRKKNQKLLKEQKHILENSDKMIFYLRSMQERMEAWNRQDGEFFDCIMPTLQMIYGHFSAIDGEGAEEILKNLKNRLRDSWRMLVKDNRIKLWKEPGAQLKTRDVDNALQRFEDDKESYENNVLYQNLLLPLLCILAGNDFSGSDVRWKQEADEILQKEGLRALYWEELASDDAANRGQFSRINEGIETPGLFRVKKEKEYELFGNYQGRVKRCRKENT